MNVEELKLFSPRKSGVILKAEARKKSSIYVPGQPEHDIMSHTYTVLAMGPNVTDLEIGEEVYPMTGVLADLSIEGSDQNVSYYYCEEGFVKLHKKFPVVQVPTQWDEPTTTASPSWITVNTDSTGGDGPVYVELEK